MRAFAKWAGFALVFAGIVVFPVAIWVPGPWGVLTLLLVMAGCVLLLASLIGRPSTPEQGAEQAIDHADGAGPRT